MKTKLFISSISLILITSCNIFFNKKKVLQGQVVIKFVGFYYKDTILIKIDESVVYEDIISSGTDSEAGGTAIKSSLSKQKLEVLINEEIYLFLIPKRYKGYLYVMDFYSGVEFSLTDKPLDTF